MSQSKWPASGLESYSAYRKFAKDDKEKWLTEYDKVADPLLDQLLENFEWEDNNVQEFTNIRFV